MVVAIRQTMSEVLATTSVSMIYCGDKLICAQFLTQTAVDSFYVCGRHELQQASQPAAGKGMAVKFTFELQSVVEKRLEKARGVNHCPFCVSVAQ